MGLLSGQHVEVIQTVDSTQDEIRRRLVSGGSIPDALLTLDQTKGRGRFGREWISTPGDSLTVSFVMKEHVGHPKPWLLGFSMGLAIAGALHTKMQWPNDLTINRRKVGGILTELIPMPDGSQMPVIGVGINLNQMVFPPEIEERATSILRERGVRWSPEDAVQAIIERCADMPDGRSWDELLPIWSLFDDTPGKPYLLSTGETAVSLGIGPEGELICAVDGETRSVLAADAIFG